MYNSFRNNILNCINYFAYEATLHAVSATIPTGPIGRVHQRHTGRERHTHNSIVIVNNCYLEQMQPQKPPASRGGCPPRGGGGQPHRGGGGAALPKEGIHGFILSTVCHVLSRLRGVRGLADHGPYVRRRGEAFVTRFRRLMSDVRTRLSTDVMAAYTIKLNYY